MIAGEGLLRSSGSNARMVWIWLKNLSSSSCRHASSVVSRNVETRLAGVVDEQVEARERARNSVGESRNVRCARHVAGVLDDASRAMIALELLARLQQPLAIATADRHARPFDEEKCCRGQPNARAAAGDHSEPA